MRDLFSSLPLSNRVPTDETAVSTDRRDAVAALVEEIGRLEPPLTPEEIVRFARDAGLAAEERRASGDVAGLAREVRSAKRSLRRLSATLRAALALAKERGVELTVPTAVSGAAALYASGTAPFERRAAIAGYTVRATDADWSFGAGPVAEAPALEIAAFLLGVSDDPPRPPDRPSAAI